MFKKAKIFSYIASVIFYLSKKNSILDRNTEETISFRMTLFLLIMRNMRSKKKIKRQQCATRESGGPFRKVYEGLAIHPFIIRELVTPFRSFSPSSDSPPSPPYHPLPFLPHSDPFISMFVTAFSVVALFETTLMGVNVKPISTAATCFRIFRNVLLYITGINRTIFLAMRRK